MTLAMQKTGPLDHLETASIDELRHEQLQRLRWTLNHAYDKVPFYKAAFDRSGLKPADIRTLEDLSQVPFTMKQDLRDNYPFGMFATPMKQIVRLHASSGTTGKPTVVGYTQNDINTWADVVARSIRAAGGHPGDKVHIAYGYGLFTGGLGAHYGAEKLGCSVIPMSGGQTERQVQLLKDFQPDIIMVTPSYLLNLADEIERQGIKPGDLALRLGIFGAEPWTNAMRDEIEQRLGIDALDIYGLSEVMGPGVGMECLETKDGPTIWEDHFYPEILDPFTGDVLPEGESGELVFSALTREALPIIRFRTHDLTTLRPGTARTGHRRMDRIVGHSDDMIIVRGVNLFPSQIEEIALEIETLSPHFQLEITRPNRLDELTVKIERRATASMADAQAGGQELRARIKNRIGCTSRIEIAEPETLARSSGKLRRIYDLRQQ